MVILQARDPIEAIRLKANRLRGDQARQGDRRDAANACRRLDLAGPAEDVNGADYAPASKLMDTVNF